MAEHLRWQVRPGLRDPLLVLAFEGWNDAGESATTAARYLAVQLGAAPLAEIDPEVFFDFTVRRPTVSVSDGVIDRLEWPETRFSYASVDDAHELVVGLAIEPHLRWRLYVEQLLALVDALRVRRAVLLGAYLADVLYSRPVSVTGVASRAELLSRHRIEATRYEGPTGIVGVVGRELRAHGLDVIALWAGLPHYLNVSPNPRGALALLEGVAPILDLTLHLEPLRAAARDCEQRMSQMVSADPELSEYVRELKRREFAQ